METWQFALGVLGIMITIVGGFIKMTRKVSEVEISLLEKIEAKDKETRGQLMLAVDRSRTEFGESLKAIKQHSIDAHERIDHLHIKHQELELYIRDNFVGVPSFKDFAGRVEKFMERLDEKMTKFFSREP
jgi:hypothetical protein